jgi:hypothetical protein
MNTQTIRFTTITVLAVALLFTAPILIALLSKLP